MVIAILWTSTLSPSQIFFCTTSPVTDLQTVHVLVTRSLFLPYVLTTKVTLARGVCWLSQNSFYTFLCKRFLRSWCKIPVSGWSENSGVTINFGFERRVYKKTAMNWRHLVYWFWKCKFQHMYLGVRGPGEKPTWGETRSSDTRYSHPGQGSSTVSRGEVHYPPVTRD